MARAIKAIFGKQVNTQSNLARLEWNSLLKITNRQIMQIHLLYSGSISRELCNIIFEKLKSALNQLTVIAPEDISSTHIAKTNTAAGWLLLSDTKKISARELGKIPARKKIIRDVDQLGAGEDLGAKASQLVEELNELAKLINSEIKRQAQEVPNDSYSSYDELASQLAINCRNHLREKLGKHGNLSQPLDPHMYSEISYFHPPRMSSGTTGATDVSMCVYEAERLRNLPQQINLQPVRASNATTSAMAWESVFTLVYAALVYANQKNVKEVSMESDHARVIIKQPYSDTTEESREELEQELISNLRKLSVAASGHGNFWRIEDQNDTVSLIFNKHLASRK